MCNFISTSFQGFFRKNENPRGVKGGRGERKERRGKERRGKGKKGGEKERKEGGREERREEERREGGKKGGGKKGGGKKGGGKKGGREGAKNCCMQISPYILTLFSSHFAPFWRMEDSAPRSKKNQKCHKSAGFWGGGGNVQIQCKFSHGALQKEQKLKRS